MPTLSGFDHSFFDMNGSSVELNMKGAGRPLLFLHPGEGLLGAGPALCSLAEVGRVIVPSHPGFGGSELPRSFTDVDDLAYFYLDLMDALDLRDVILLGASFGGWIACQIAIKATERIGCLVLIDALGIKVGGRDQRDIADMHALDDDELVARIYADAARYRPDYKTFTDADLLTVAQNRETMTLLGWRPYMHDPKLGDRLRRVRVPTLVVWGERDGIVDLDYGRVFSERIPGSRFTSIKDAGHYPYVEQPARFCQTVQEFIRPN